MSFPYKEWIRFYFKLTLVAAWNGVLRYMWVVSGAAAATLTQVIDIRTLGWRGAGYILAGTVFASVAGALYKHQIPDPSEPVSPAEAAPQTGAPPEVPPVS